MPWVFVPPVYQSKREYNPSQTQLSAETWKKRPGVKQQVRTPYNDHKQSTCQVALPFNIWYRPNDRTKDRKVCSPFVESSISKCSDLGKKGSFTPQALGPKTQTLLKLYYIFMLFLTQKVFMDCGFPASDNQHTSSNSELSRHSYES